jgi:hypothetical protein
MLIATEYVSESSVDLPPPLVVPVFRGTDKDVVADIVSGPEVTQNHDAATRRVVALHKNVF